MKYLLPILALTTVPAFADVQINQSAADGQFLHAPYDPGNTDNEYYIGNVPMSPNRQDGATQSAFVVATMAVPEDEVPLELQPLRSPRDVYTITDADTNGEQCTLTDVNGDARQIDTWEVTFRKIPYADRSMVQYEHYDELAAFRVTVRCSDR